MRPRRYYPTSLRNVLGMGLIGLPLFMGFMAVKGAENPADLALERPTDSGKELQRYVECIKTTVRSMVKAPDPATELVNVADVLCKVHHGRIEEAIALTLSKEQKPAAHQVMLDHVERIKAETAALVLRARSETAR